MSILIAWVSVNVLNECEYIAFKYSADLLTADTDYYVSSMKMLSIVYKMILCESKM